MCSLFGNFLSGPIEIKKRGVTADDRSVVWVVLVI